VPITDAPPGGTLLAARRRLKHGQLCVLTGWLGERLVGVNWDRKIGQKNRKNWCQEVMVIKAREGVGWYAMLRVVW